MIKNILILFLNFQISLFAGTSSATYQEDEILRLSTQHITQDTTEDLHTQAAKKFGTQGSEIENESPFCQRLLSQNKISVFLFVLTLFVIAGVIGSIYLSNDITHEQEKIFDQTFHETCFFRVEDLDDSHYRSRIKYSPTFRERLMRTFPCKLKTCPTEDWIQEIKNICRSRCLETSDIKPFVEAMRVGKIFKKSCENSVSLVLKKWEDYNVQIRFITEQVVTDASQYKKFFTEPHRQSMRCLCELWNRHVRNPYKGYTGYGLNPWIRFPACSSFRKSEKNPDWLLNHPDCIE